MGPFYLALFAGLHTALAGSMNAPFEVNMVLLLITLWGFGWLQRLGGSHKRSHSFLLEAGRFTSKRIEVI